MTSKKTLGFIGLGVMGEPMCRHLIAKSGSPVVIFDLMPEPVGRLAALGATPARSAARDCPSGGHRLRLAAERQTSSGLMRRTRRIDCQYGTWPDRC